MPSKNFHTDDELFAALSLRYTKGLGDVTMIKIRKSFGSMVRAVSSDPQIWEELGVCKIHTAQKMLSQLNHKQAEQEIAFAKSRNLELRLWDAPNYPTRLKHCDDAPYILYTRGKCLFPHNPIISIVGTRKLTPYGVRMVSEVLEGLAYLNPMVVSGLAYGIDIAAHRKSLELGLSTVAVLAHNFNRLYPAEHLEDAKKMEVQGGLISDFPSFAPFHSSGFVQRNRIIAGISDLLIVVESPTKGGSLITAGLANSYNREVYAVPGRTSDVMSLGCNKLIMSHKARIFVSIDEMISCMGWGVQADKKNISNTPADIPIKVDSPKFSSEDQRRIFEFLSDQGKQNFETIQEVLKIDISKLYKELLQMELQGILNSLPARHYTVSD